MPAGSVPEAPRLDVTGAGATVADPVQAGPDLAQAEIDRLLNG